MIRIGIIRETKIPPDNRTPFSPKQCNEIIQQYPEVEFYVQPSPGRSFSDTEYQQQGITVQEDLGNCDLLFGIKEPSIETLIPGKTYLVFSHTKKKQPHNHKLMHALIDKKIRLIDYECLTHDDGHRIVGFGYWAGVVGAHNGLMTYGRKTGTYALRPVYTCKNFLEVKESYEGFIVPNIKIALTGSGRVSTGVLDILNYLDITEVSPADYIGKTFKYPVFTQLKGKDLYARKEDGTYDRDDFHTHPEAYECLFAPYAAHTDILMNGVYWDKKIPRLFEMEDIQDPGFRISVIADITCDENGSVPCNLGSSTIADPVYGVDKATRQRCAAYLPLNQSIDVMAVDNLPNELPRDASKYFGVFLMSYVLPDLIHQQRTGVITRATICENGKLTPAYDYLADYAYE